VRCLSASENDRALNFPVRTADTAAQRLESRRSLTPFALFKATKGPKIPE